MKIVTVVGARPQFIKASAVSRAIAARGARDAGSVHECLVHTGQHFDANMSDVFFQEMDIRAPDHHLGISGGGHGAMTGRMLEAMEERLLETTPDWVVVYGDTNSTLAGALAAAKLHVPVAHVEAGLRSFNRKMPEETNRVVADHVSDLLFAPTPVAVENLRREGIPEERICPVGDVMYDVILHHRPEASRRAEALLAELGVTRGGYVLSTIHRAENTDDPRRLAGIVEGLATVGDTLPVVCPVHPRTRQALEKTKLGERARAALRMMPPVGYLDMLALQGAAAVIATDSGGVQKEAFFNRVPCITLRDETEWVELIEVGANRLVGADAEEIVRGFEWAREAVIPDEEIYGDGRAADVIVNHLVERRSSSVHRATASP
ncbi:MAG: UDP-N-acetylglucosamine 2-epimerase (non-hydrolyzing) [Planctomycetes bacterium]|nr:UDP-N-acetylglucosamine 2-epimerase (non-hydrolyzing) [Planctomycetota bacterium]